MTLRAGLAILGGWFLPLIPVAAYVAINRPAVSAWWAVPATAVSAAYWLLSRWAGWPNREFWGQQ